MFNEQFYNLANQCIESIDVIDNTRNIETLKSRIELLRDRLAQILTVYDFNTALYEALLTETFSRYCYLWEKEIQPVHLYILKNPNGEKLEQFISRRIYDSYERFYYYKKDEINKLKTSTAIEKRKNEIIKTGYDFKYLYKFLNVEDHNNYQDKIEEFRKQFYWEPNN